MTDSNGLEYTQKEDGTREYRIAKSDEAKLPKHVAGGSVALLFESGAMSSIKMFLEKTQEWASF